MSRPSVVIVSPALAAANNGNWQTARRWAQFLHGQYDVRIVQEWQDSGGLGELMIALHARRSASSVRAWASKHPGRGLALVLTGTDLYRDIGVDPEARRSLDCAQRLVVLQELGVNSLPPEHRAKARVIFQSATARKPMDKSDAKLVAVMVGHMRDVKSPGTLLDAAVLLRARSDIQIRHIGRAEEAEWADRAQATAVRCPAYRWLGALNHEQTRRAIQRAHVLVHTSAMEGGAHVIMEAVRSGTPVLASRVDGNVGMLGADYQGYFPYGDPGALAALLECARQGQAGDVPSPSLLARLRAQCALRAPLFEPQAERHAVLQLVHELQESS